MKSTPNQVAIPNDVNITDNICADCLHRAGIDGMHFLLFDTGLCGRCGQTTDVYDSELQALYRGAGIAENVVYSQLPRLRRYPHKILSMFEIGQKLARVLKASGND